MATILLSILIFGSAGCILYRQFTKGGSCHECPTDHCHVKTTTTQHTMKK